VVTLDSAQHGSTSTLQQARRHWQFGVALGLTVLVLAYLLFVQTATGQALENAALRGADQLRQAERQTASAQLGLITIRSLAAAVALLALISAWRRRLDLMIASAGMVLVALGVTQVLKRFVLPRPALVEAAESFTGNSFPSGHTTTAMGVLLALIIVCTPRWRTLVLYLATSYALGVAAWTLSAKWHRLSDTLGAEGIVLATACLASLWLSGRSAVQPVTVSRGGWLRRMFIGLLLLSGLAGLGLGLYLIGATGLPAGPDPGHDYVIFLGLNSLASAGSILTALLFWWSWQDLEVRRRER
jgi:membrane-associated phospholipid phosphatase